MSAGTTATSPPRHGLEIDESALSGAFAQAFRAAPRRASTGISRPDDDKGWWRTVVRQVLTACGHTPPDTHFHAMFEELYAHFAQPGVWALYPEVPAVLETLHARYPLAIVSNFDRRLYPILEDLGIRHYFQHITISSEAGIDKPDPAIFTPALQALGVTPAEAILAGDHPDQDWQAAETAGLHVYRVERPGRGLEGLPSLLN